MARSISDKARTTNGMHTALYFWYFAIVLFAGFIGGYVFSGNWGGALLDPENFAWKGFAGTAIGAAILGSPVMVFFSLGESMLMELMDINEAVQRVDKVQGV